MPQPNRPATIPSGPAQAAFALSAYRNVYARFLVFSAPTFDRKSLSGRRPVVKGLVELCERFGCGHVFGLLAREMNVPLALMLVRMALLPNQQDALVMALALFPGLPSRSVGSHRFRRRPQCGSPCDETSFLLSVLVQAAAGRSS